MRTDATATFAQTVLGDRPGYVALAIGHQPHWDEKGRYTHREWSETRFAWPAEQDRLVTEVKHLVAADDCDVYVFPAVRFTDDRRKGSALPPQICWVDLDGEPTDVALWEQLEPYVVASGQPGHRHAYLPLTRPVDLGVHAQLNKRLTARLGGDHKWSDESLLRIPGTFNHKTTPPTLVTVESPNGRTWNPDELAALLGVHNDTVAAPAPAPARAEPVSLTELPTSAYTRIGERLADTSPTDRSRAVYALVGACRDAGLTEGQTVAVVSEYKPGRDKYGDRLEQEVARCYGKIEASATSFVPKGSGGYFDKEFGLLAATLAGDIIGMGPLAEGVDDILWSYRDGVWSPDKNVARARTAYLLGERSRRSHSTNVEDVVRSRVRRITCDPVPEYLNFQNGLYSWQADMLTEHTPDVLSTVQLGVDYNPDATCPEFDTFLDQVLPTDMVALAWELLGYLMFSGNPLHKAVMLTGTGRNGKGTFLRVVNALLGQGNVTSVSLHDLVNTRFSTASLFGKIANVAGDIDGTYLESTATFKAITGQDLISAEHKGRDRFDFVPWAVPLFSANKIPASSDVTTGYLSRWLVVPFPRDFTGREDRHLDE